MKKFTLKFSVFLFPILLLYSVNLMFNDLPLSEEMEMKAGSFLGNLSADTIIVAGDSRAERQIIPAVVKKKTGRECYNVAIGSGDLITSGNLLQKYRCLTDNRVIILSASIFQLNDSSIEPGYISYSAILNMSLPDQFALLKGDFIFTYQKIFRMIVQNYSNRDYALPSGDHRIGKKGYYEVNDHREPKRSADLESIRKGHPWYKAMVLRGIRYKVLKKAIKRLGESSAKIVIYQPPVSPVWFENTRNTFVDDGEKLFGRMLRYECAKYKNIEFINFYKWKIRELEDHHYYDTHHLKLKGAILFTSILVDKLRGLNVI